MEPVSAVVGTISLGRTGLRGRARPTIRPMAAPSVLIAEDQVLLREGLARLLQEQGFDVVAQAGDPNDLIRKATAHRPDVAIVDVQMPPDGTDDGLRAVIRLCRALPDVGV